MPCADTARRSSRPWAARRSTLAQRPREVNRSLRAEGGKGRHDRPATALPKLKDDLRKALDLVKNYLAENAELAASSPPSNVCPELVKDGNLELYDGHVEARVPGDRSCEFDDSPNTAPTSGNTWRSETATKFPFYRPLGFAAHTGWAPGTNQRLRRRTHPRGIGGAGGLPLIHH